MSVPTETIGKTDIYDVEKELKVLSLKRQPNGRWGAKIRISLYINLNDGRTIPFDKDVEIGNVLQIGKKTRKK